MRAFRARGNSREATSPRASRSTRHAIRRAPSHSKRPKPAPDHEGQGPSVRHFHGHWGYNTNARDLGVVENSERHDVERRLLVPAGDSARQPW